MIDDPRILDVIIDNLKQAFDKSDTGHLSVPVDYIGRVVGMPQSWSMSLAQMLKSKDAIQAFEDEGIEMAWGITQWDDDSLGGRTMHFPTIKFSQLERV